MENKLVIIGVGLIGGSIGLAVKHRLPGKWRVVGCGPRAMSLRQAKQLAAIDDYSFEIEDAVRDADIVIVCSPVSTIPTIFRTIQRSVKKSCLVTDVGSTKASIVKAGDRLLRERCLFVGSHPMAGSEKQGVAFADKDLFEGKTLVLTPTTKTPVQAVKRATEFWESLGMRITTMLPRQHDKLVSVVSHLPHVTATALANIQSPESISIHGSGFADSTRIAAGNPRLWTDILSDNREELVNALGQLTAELSEFRRLLISDDQEGLEEWLAQGKKIRDQLSSKKGKSRQPQYWIIDVRPNRLADRLRNKNGQQALFPDSVEEKQTEPIRKQLLRRFEESLQKSIERSFAFEGLQVPLVRRSPTRLFVLAKADSVANPLKTEKLLKQMVSEALYTAEGMDPVAISSIIRDPEVIAIEKFDQDRSHPLQDTWRSFLRDFSPPSIGTLPFEATLIERLLRRLGRAISSRFHS